MPLEMWKPTRCGIPFATDAPGTASEVATPPEFGSGTPIAGTRSTFGVSGGMASGQAPRTYDRVVERRRAVALARHFREAEGLSIAQIAVRLGRSPATVKSYFYDPTGEKAGATRTRTATAARGAANGPLPRRA